MVSKADITNAFNQVFSSNKVYAELDEFEKLYALLVISNSSGEVTDIATETTLDLVNDKLPTLGAKTANNSIPVTLSTNGTFATAFGLATDTTATTDTANTGFISLIKRLLEKLTAGINTVVTNLVPTVSISGSRNITDANTFEVLTTSNTLASGIYVQARTTNTGLVTVRSLGTSDGVVLEKGQNLFFVINNSNKLEIAVSVPNEGIRWWGS